MNNFQIVQSLIDYGTSKGWHILLGDNFYQNYEASLKEYDSGDLVLAIFPFVSVIPRTKTIYNDLTYRGLVLLGRKFETATVSNLDETYAQKYANRLKALAPLLANALLEFACNNELELSGEIAEELNKLDTNIDFVGGIFTFFQ